jgi:predicted TIM-barrel enzyme
MNDTLFAPKLTPNPTDNNAILSMAVAADGSVWMGTRAGVNVWRGDSVHTLTTAEGLGSNFVRSVFAIATA